MLIQFQDQKEKFDKAESKFHGALLASTTELEREKQINREYAHFEAVVAKAQIIEDQLQSSKDEIHRLREERQTQQKELHRLRKEVTAINKRHLREKEMAERAWEKSKSKLKAVAEEAAKELEMTHAILEAHKEISAKERSFLANMKERRLAEEERRLALQQREVRRLNHGTPNLCVCLVWVEGAWLG